MKRTISARADGAVCIGREAVLVGVFLIKIVPVQYLITLCFSYNLKLSLPEVYDQTAEINGFTAFV